MWSMWVVSSMQLTDCFGSLASITDRGERVWSGNAGRWCSLASCVLSMKAELSTSISAQIDSLVLSVGEINQLLNDRTKQRKQTDNIQ